MKDLGQEALDEMNRLLLNQKRLKMKLERMGDNQIADIGKKVERLQKQLNEANKLLKYCCANYESSRFGATITEDGEILPKGPVWNYLKKWGVK